MRRMFRPLLLPRLVPVEPTLEEGEGKVGAMKFASRTTIAALVLTISGLALSAAQAATRPDDRAGIRGIEASTSVRPDDRAGIRGIGQTSAAQAATRPDDRAGIRGIGQTSAVAQAATRPDDRAGIRGIGQASAVALDSSDVVSPYVANVLQSGTPQAVRPDDRAGTLGPGNDAVSAQQTTLASSDGFNWSVALISAGGGLAFVLLLSVTGMGVIRHRHSHLKSA
jgi:hypothetical protein